MAEQLLALTAKEFLPLVTSFDFSVTSHDESPAFGDETVVLQAGELRVRLVRERSQLFVDLGSSAEPGSWFDSAVVMDYMGLSSDAGFHDRDERRTLRGLADFLKTFQTELVVTFGTAEFPMSKQQLSVIRDARATARFGPLP